MLGGLALGTLLGVLGLIYIERGPAVTVLEQSDVGEIAMHDDRIFLHTKYVRHRACSADTTRWLQTTVDYQGRPTPVLVRMASSGLVPVGTLGLNDFILSFPLPPGLWPGKWYYQAITMDHCGVMGWLSPARRESKLVPIDIERARATADQPVVAMQNGRPITRGRSPLAK